MSVFSQAYDPLYDTEVSIEQQLYFKVKAAIMLVIETGRSMDRIFRMYLISKDEWRIFADAHPQEVDKLKAAKAVFFLSYAFCPTHGIFARTAAQHLAGAGCPQCEAAARKAARQRRHLKLLAWHQRLRVAA